MPVRVLIVDDSPTIRRLIRARIGADPRLTVVGEASDAFEAREKIKALNPDVLTLDVEMPRMDGLAFLEKLMRLRPMPVVMVSTLTERGGAAALEALSLGAVECIGKGGGSALAASFEHLPDILIMAAKARLHGAGARAIAAPPADYSWNGRLVLIGASTGGVDALETLLAGYPAHCPPTLITQHMPPSFLASFAARLAQKFAPRVLLAEDGMPIEPGHVYLAPGGAYHLALAAATPPRCRLISAEPVNGHRPSVDVLFDSALPLAPMCLSVLLTGMGRDGAAAMLRLRQNGARCLAQDEASSVVFGMPRAALHIGAAEAAVPIADMARQILALTRGEALAVQRGMAV
ncbi:MAG: chemotaxis response regulator protein-glutamate methylesterase [Phaeovulum sp.]|uniref:protein-glutamate methylesterase/protein-glutamine glutaminase n=1 Tax=Phaeovulum sp. TaxID=2934796 RepID=UPI0027346329|nr:chemotaxis response regulator protein-glutamate methylesterase [Phaeovulum sp.]MDP3862926.1 chemotaxis response regulator protein-glutamate methylesterase [Phaeovulum sp.]